MSDPSPAGCALCGLRLPARPYQAVHRNENLPFCCSGCRQVFLLLAESGLLEGDFRTSELYRTSLRLGIIGRPDPAPGPEALPADLEGTSELFLHVDGMWCSSCSWLIEKVIGAEKGVVRTSVLYASDTARITYRPEQTAPAEITAAVERLGYHASSRDADPDAHVQERRSLLIKMGVALFLLNNIMFFSYVLYIGYFQEVAAEMKRLVPMILFGMTLPSILWCGFPIHRKAWASIRNAAPTMELLFSIGIVASFSYSVYEMLRGGEHFYFDTAAALVALLLVGKFLELSAKQKASEGIHRLYRMLPRKVRIIAPEGERLVGIEKLQPGDSFVVKAGEKVPADGIVVQGTATVDESLLTGESRPLPKAPGDAVVASSMNVNGHLTVRATVIGDGTVLAGIIRMVEGALTSKSPLERTVDRVTRVFIPAVLLLAASTGGILFMLTGSVEESLLRAITVLVIACPCVLGMATPLALAVGVGYATRQGILIRDGETFERLARVSDCVFDKTGTITEGRFALLGFRRQGREDREMLRYVGSLELSSSHPIALAIVQACATHGLPLEAADAVEIVDGKGIRGMVGGTKVVVGTEAFLRVEGFCVDRADIELFLEEKKAGRTVVCAGVEGKREVLVMVLGDAVKHGALDAVRILRGLGIGVRLLSGDASETTASIAAQAGIGAHQGNALPAEKIAQIADLQKEGKRVAMVGDGVNDAPALAQADVGIAMGSGTQMAVESAGVTLLRDDLTLVPEAIHLARRTVRTVRQNLLWAFLYNSVGLVLAAAGVLNPLIAAAAMLVSSLSVVINSMRLRQKEGRLGRMLFDILVPWWEP
jgi:heavy metal translocating P-type ATPase